MWSNSFHHNHPIYKMNLKSPLFQNKINTTMKHSQVSWPTSTSYSTNIYWPKNYWIKINRTFWHSQKSIKKLYRHNLISKARFSHHNSRKHSFCRSCRFWKIKWIHKKLKFMGSSTRLIKNVWKWKKLCWPCKKLVRSKVWSPKST